MIILSAYVMSLGSPWNMALIAGSTFKRKEYNGILEFNRLMPKGLRLE